MPVKKGKNQYMRESSEWVLEIMRIQTNSMRLKLSKTKFPNLSHAFLPNSRQTAIDSFSHLKQWNQNYVASLKRFLK